MTLALAGQRVVVVGLGTSGVAACRLALARGATVVGTDAKTEASPGARALAAEGVRLVLGGHEAPAIAKEIEDADLVVVSPGVPAFPELQRAEAKGVRIWGEVELAVQALRHPAPVVAVGGTNGKSTTTSLVGELLARRFGHERVFVGGNLGEPLASHVDEEFSAIVLEVSSFQMERVEAFRPKVALLLNVSPDHLDRYPSEAAYAEAKGNAFVRQTADDVAVVPAGDPVCLAQARRGKAKIVTFGPGGDVDVRADSIAAGEAVYPRAKIALQGGHNALNVAAALAAVRPFGIEPAAIADVLRTFHGLPHRMVFVRERGGVRFYDDSKGTNVGASVTAVRGVSEDKVVLLAGGRDKGGSYGPLVEALKERGRAAVLLGEAKDLIASAIGGALPTKTAATMDEAVAIAAELAAPGDAVLLSPACSSFDMFEDYKDRGDAFVRAVMALP
jgi:UDP-N-acetylmuramoylalanine--D-glutamate ligase